MFGLLHPMASNLSKLDMGQVLEGITPVSKWYPVCTRSSGYKRNSSQEEEGSTVSCGSYLHCHPRVPRVIITVLLTSVVAISMAGGEIAFSIISASRAAKLTLYRHYKLPQVQVMILYLLPIQKIHVIMEWRAFTCAVVHRFTPLGGSEMQSA